jgi:hypothetical protein
MLKPTGSHFLFIWLLFLVGVLACRLGGVQQQAAPSLPPTTPPQPLTAASPVPSYGTFTLTLPDGQVMTMPMSKCEGRRPGDSLDVRAVSTQDVTDPKRVEVQLGGKHQGTGPLQNTYIAVSIGAEAKLAFTGNTVKAQATIEENGSGRFTDAAIVNVAVNSPSYRYGSEYKFSGQWSCQPTQSSGS